MNNKLPLDLQKIKRIKANSEKQNGLIKIDFYNTKKYTPKMHHKPISKLIFFDFEK